MIKSWMYLLELKKIPVQCWTKLALNQTIDQDQVSIDLSFLPLNFQGSMDEALWYLYNDPRSFSEDNWEFQKARLSMAWKKGQDLPVPLNMEPKKIVFKHLRFLIITDTKESFS